MVVVIHNRYSRHSTLLLPPLPFDTIWVSEQDGLIKREGRP
ncbi:uncharacterized protein G2W53_028813 [Senna tora]|uniref:Uncharacterized protein n=1 Tax=Senna tora TaxID=362788 RepID=A0A834TCY0_9FABA|nr:uncharacterized protein G2W53_028813 [Senna tora]